MGPSLLSSLLSNSSQVAIQILSSTLFSYFLPYFRFYQIRSRSSKLCWSQLMMNPII